MRRIIGLLILSVCSAVSVAQQQHVGPTPPGTPSNGSHQQVHVGPKPPQTSNSSNINWQTIRNGEQSRMTRAGLFEINSEAEYQTYYRQAFGELPSNPIRGINFQTEKLVAVHLGQRNTSGYRVNVQRLWQINPTTVRITAIEQMPNQNDFTAQQITSPWVLIKVQRGAFNLTLQMQKFSGVQNGFEILPFPGQNGGWGGNGGNGGGTCNCSGCTCGCGCGG